MFKNTKVLTGCSPLDPEGPGGPGGPLGPGWPSPVSPLKFRIHYKFDFANVWSGLNNFLAVSYRDVPISFCLFVCFFSNPI